MLERQIGILLAHAPLWEPEEVYQRVFVFCFFSFLFFLIFIFTLFYFTILYWFCHTLTWICHGCTWVPNPEPPSHPISSLYQRVFENTWFKIKPGFIQAYIFLVFVMIGQINLSLTSLTNSFLLKWKSCDQHSSSYPLTWSKGLPSSGPLPSRWILFLILTELWPFTKQSSFLLPLCFMPSSA